MITDLRSFESRVSCHTKFRFAEREAQCILGECGPLKCNPFLTLFKRDVKESQPCCSDENTRLPTNLISVHVFVLSVMKSAQATTD